MTRKKQEPRFEVVQGADEPLQPEAPALPGEAPEVGSLLSDGEVINDRYEIHGVLGEGGLALVYGGVDRQTGGEVALKVLRPSILAAEATRHDALERFDGEAEMTQRAQHPNVVAVLDTANLDGHSPVIVMERLHGHNLAVELERNGPMAQERAIGLMVQCLEGLAAVHERGVIHRDIKPENLFLVNPGQPDESIRLVDFGFAYADDATQRITAPDFRVGSMRYLSPEYITNREISRRGDVYQAGLVFAELLMGRPVVQDKQPHEIVDAHVKGLLKITRELAEGPLREIFGRSLAREPSARFEDAAQMRDALRALQQAPARADESAAPAREEEPDALRSAARRVASAFWKLFRDKKG